jgi:hypothetical protein
MTTEGFARVVKTAVMATVDDVARAVDDLHELVRAEGRDPADVSVQLDGFGLTDMDAGDGLERAAALQAVGVTHVVVRPPRGPTGEVLESLERFGAEVIAKA